MGTHLGRIGPPPPHIVTTEVEGDVGLYNPIREEVAILSETASAIWRLSDGSRTLEEIVDHLAGSYSVDHTAIRRDVEGAVGTLVEGGFLTSGA